MQRPRGWRPIFAPRRLLVVLLAGAMLVVPFQFVWESGFWSLVVRVGYLALATLLAFGIFEQWPRRLPRWLARWVLQVLAVALVIPVVNTVVWIASTAPGAPPFWAESDRLGGLALLTVLPLLIAPWIALSALVRQREAVVRDQALAFALERSELERQAASARLALMRAQVAPHFLFNTLANIKALVETGSARAPAVLDSLIVYLRAAVPRLDVQSHSIRDELTLVRAYLALMHMRIPDRLDFAITLAPECESQACVPWSILTLVENAVRHGIDPSETGGQIDVRVRAVDGQLVVEVEDDGVGLAGSSSGLGTGLASLRERLRGHYGEAARLQLESGASGHGAIARLQWPLTSP